MEKTGTILGFFGKQCTAVSTVEENAFADNPCCTLALFKLLTSVLKRGSCESHVDKYIALPKPVTVCERANHI
jgi:hypothetical protein